MMNIIERNKRIFLIFDFSIALIIVAYICLRCHCAWSPEFKQIINGYGVPLSIIESIFLYLLGWVFFSMIPSANVFLWNIILYSFLHRKDLPPKSKYAVSDDFWYMGTISFAVPYTVSFFLIVLQAFGIIDLSVF